MQWDKHKAMPLVIKALGKEDRNALLKIAPGVFDHPLDEQWTTEFFDDPRHHLIVAIDSGIIVGMASGVHYVHPDKRPELWINEVGVAPSHRGQGIGGQLLRALLDVGRQHGCCEAWVLTNRDNVPAMRLYTGQKGVASDQVMFTFDLRAEGYAR